MAKPHAIIGWTTAVLLGTSGYLYKQNKDAFERETVATDKQQENLNKQTKRLDKANADLKATTDKRVATDNEVARLQGEEKAEKQTLADLESQLTTKKTEIAQSKSKLDELAKQLEGTGDLKEIASKVRGIRRDIEELTQTIASQESKLASLNGTIASTDRQIARLQEEASWPARKISNPNLKTRISAIYPQWGFVTIAAGNHSGVTDNSILEVVRDGETIAKLQVSSVEANSASASIVPDSVKEDVLMVPGDRVVASAAPAATKPTAAAAPAPVVP